MFDGSHARDTCKTLPAQVHDTLDTQVMEIGFCAETERGRTVERNSPEDHGERWVDVLRRGSSAFPVTSLQCVLVNAVVV